MTTPFWQVSRKLENTLFGEPMRLNLSNKKVDDDGHLTMTDYKNLHAFTQIGRLEVKLFFKNLMCIESVGALNDLTISSFDPIDSKIDQLFRRRFFNNF